MYIYVGFQGSAPREGPYGQDGTKPLIKRRAWFMHASRSSINIQSVL